jgi:hypothetical protein
MRSFRAFRKSLRGSLAVPAKILTGWLLKQNCSCSGISRKRSSFRIIAIFLTCFIAALHLFIISLSNTDQLVISEPEFLDSYEKVLSQADLMPIWIADHNDDARFRRSATNSLQHKLWLKNRKMCKLMKSNHCLLSFKNVTTKLVIKAIADQELVLIGANFVTSIVHAAICPIADSLGFNPLVLTKDKDEAIRPMGLGYSHHLEKTQPYAAVVIRFRARKTAESGVLQKLAKITKSPLDPNANRDVVRRCLNPIRTGSSKQNIISPKSLSHFSIASYILLLLIISSMIIHGTSLVINQ